MAKIIKIVHSRKARLYLGVFENSQIDELIKKGFITLVANEVPRYPNEPVKDSLVLKLNKDLVALVGDHTNKINEEHLGFLRKLYRNTEDNPSYHHNSNNPLSANGGNITESKIDSLALHNEYISRLDLKENTGWAYFYEQ